MRNMLQETAALLDRAEQSRMPLPPLSQEYAKAHVRHAKALREAGCIAVDLTPAARGPYVVPPANLAEHLDKVNVNMVTCGGQATTPMIYAVSRVTPVRYAEMISTIASLSAGPGTRQNIDEFTETTSTALAVIGGAQQGKAIIILNPKELRNASRFSHPLYPKAFS